MQTYTDFKKQIVRLLHVKGKNYGLGVKELLEDYYDEEIHTARVYQNLDALIEDGVVKRGKYDRRTNSYELTEKGEEFAQEEAAVWSEVVKDTGKSKEDNDR